MEVLVYDEQGVPAQNREQLAYQGFDEGEFVDACSELLEVGNVRQGVVAQMEGKIEGQIELQ